MFLSFCTILASIALSLFLIFVEIIILPRCQHYFSGQCLQHKLVVILYNLDLLQFEEFYELNIVIKLINFYSIGSLLPYIHVGTRFFSAHSVFRTVERPALKRRNDVMCCVFSKNLKLHLHPKPHLICSKLVLNFWTNLSLVVLIKLFLI